MGDAPFILALTMFFLLIGAAMPYITAEFSDSSTTVDIDELEDSVGTDFDGTSVGLGSVLLSMASMFVWNIGAGTPTFVNILILPLRLVFAFILIRNFPAIGAGGG